MHSWTTRANAVFAYATFVLLGLVVLNVVSTYWLSPTGLMEEGTFQVSVKRLWVFCFLSWASFISLWSLIDLTLLPLLLLVHLHGIPPLILLPLRRLLHLLLRRVLLCSTTAVPTSRRRAANANADRSDFAVVNIDVDVDFRSAFNWNTKQLFVYALAEYSTEKNVSARSSLLYLSRGFWGSSSSRPSIR
jgi:hypothetical protein